MWIVGEKEPRAWKYERYKIRNPVPPPGEITRVILAI